MRYTFALHQRENQITFYAFKSCLKGNRWCYHSRWGRDRERRWRSRSSGCGSTRRAGSTFAPSGSQPEGKQRVRGHDVQDWTSFPPFLIHVTSDPCLKSLYLYFPERHDTLASWADRPGFAPSFVQISLRCWVKGENWEAANLELFNVSAL